MFLWLLLPLLLFLSLMMMLESTEKYLMEIKCVCWENRRQCAFVAQGLEHWSRKPGVESSILSEGKGSCNSSSFNIRSVPPRT